ncbi:hypothetical protein LguiA_030139 [Lonicera macranthoides]
MLYWSCSLYSVRYEHSAYVVELDYPRKNSYDSVWVVGSCNGLFCLAIVGNPIFLWNPSTRQSRRLPNPVKVYSSRRDSWKRFQDFSYAFPLDDSGKFANRTLHSPAINDFSSGSAYSWRIIALDLANEIYGEVLQPSYGEGEFNWGCLGELLCVLCNYYGTRADVWVMKDYGVKESWTKLLTFPHRIDRGIQQYLIPLCIGKNGEVLLELGSFLILYNSKDDSFNDPQLRNFVPFLEAHAYVESVVPPNIHPGPERQQQ